MVEPNSKLKLTESTIGQQVNHVEEVVQGLLEGPPRVDPTFIVTPRRNENRGSLTQIWGPSHRTSHEMQPHPKHPHDQGTGADPSGKGSTWTVSSVITGKKPKKWRIFTRSKMEEIVRRLKPSPMDRTENCNWGNCLWATDWTRHRGKMETAENQWATEMDNGEYSVEMGAGVAGGDGKGRNRKWGTRNESGHAAPGTKFWAQKRGCPLYRFAHMYRGCSKIGKVSPRLGEPNQP